MTRISLTVLSIFVAVFLMLSFGCSFQVGDIASFAGEKEDYIVVSNRVDELLIGDLADTVSFEELEDAYRGKEIIGLGTTSMEHCGELIFMSGDCYWADPTNQGRIVKLGWAEESLPFCAIVIIGEGEKQVFGNVNGDIHQWLETKMEDLGIPLAAVEVNGTCDNVRLSIADKLPSTPSDTLLGVNIAVDDRKAWEFVGFYTFAENDQELMSVVGHPVHLHGKTINGSHGGHLQQANTVDAEVTIYPMKGYILRNRVPSLN